MLSFFFNCCISNMNTCEEDLVFGSYLATKKDSLSNFFLQSDKPLLKEM